MSGDRDFSRFEDVRRLFDDRTAYFEQFQTVRRSYDQKLESYRQKRADLEKSQREALEEIERAFASEADVDRQELSKVAPIAEDEVAKTPTRRAAYSDRMAALQAKLSLLAYIRFEDAEKREVLDAALKQGGFSLRTWVAEQDNEAFVAECDHFVCVAFRGTTSKTDQKTDFRVAVSKSTVDDHPGDVHVHSGFLAAFKSIEQPLRLALANTDAAKPIYLTGHSLGGALALIASAKFAGGDLLGERIAAVYTFGAPRVGDRHFRGAVKAPHYRIVNKYDFVPQAPPTWMSGYVHNGEPRILDSKSAKPKRRENGFSEVLLGLFSILLWPFTRRLLFMHVHNVSLYAARLDAIARVRGRWT
ncbi:MAG: lipase family protein [Hyphomonadaceae bacterium]|nr:lipase family protein [Hyphomonadaceae bacterium]